MALAVALVMGMAPLTAETLKPLLAHPHARIYGDEITAASWPSGHASAATALAMCAVLVAPRHLRPTVAVLGAIFAAAVGFSLLMLAWHLPSDVVGGYLVGTLWVALAVAGLRAAEARSQVTQTWEAVFEPWAPGSHSGSDPADSDPVWVGGPSLDEPSFTARPRMNSRSDSLFR